MHHGNNHILFGQHRRGADVPEEDHFPPAFLKIGLPAHLAVELHRGERAALKIDEDTVTGCHGRRVAARTIAMLAGDLRAEGRLPLDSPVSVKHEQCIFSLQRCGHINALFPDDRRRTAAARQRRFPKQVRGCTPGRGIGSRRRTAIVLRPAPARPVRQPTAPSGNRSTQRDKQQPCGKHWRSILFHHPPPPQSFIQFVFLPADPSGKFDNKDGS